MPLYQPRNTGLRPLDQGPADHARAFLAWLQAMGLEGQYHLEGPSGLREFYAWWTHEERQQPIIEFMWLEHFKRAVRTGTRRVHAADGSKRRLTVYVVPPLPVEVSEPQRLAA